MSRMATNEAKSDYFRLARHTTIGTADDASRVPRLIVRTQSVLLTTRRRSRECKGLHRVDLLRWQKQIEEQILRCGR
jgi:hypothetical protein